MHFVKRPWPDCRGHGGPTERFLILFEKTSFAGKDWRFSEWSKLPVWSVGKNEESAISPELAVKNFFFRRPISHVRGVRIHFGSPEKLPKSIFPTFLSLRSPVNVSALPDALSRRGVSGGAEF